MQLVLAFLAGLITGRPILFIVGFLTGGIFCVMIPAVADVMQWFVTNGHMIVNWILGG